MLTLHTAAVALGVLAGFLTFIPGGLGGREYVHTQLLLPVYGPVAALYSAVVLRVVWLVSEVAVSGLLYLAGPAGPRSEGFGLPGEPTPAGASVADE